MQSVSSVGSNMGSKASLRSRSNTSKFQPTSQARFGYLGHLSLRDAQQNPDALRNVSALDGTSFLPNVMVMQRASTPWQYNTPNRLLEEPVNVDAEEDKEDKDKDKDGGKGGGVSNAMSKKSLANPQPLPANYVRRIRRRAQKSLHNEATS